MLRALTVAVILGILAPACSPNPHPWAAAPAPPPPIGSLTGDWAGSYRTLAETGRSGSLFFRILVEHDEATGRALMNVGDRETTAMPRPGDPFSCPPELLQFVTFRTGPEGTLVGVSERYADPVSGSLVRTVYTGKVTGNVFEGSYVTEHVRSGERIHGRWHVVRRAAA